MQYTPYYSQNEAVNCFQNTWCGLPVNTRIPTGLLNKGKASGSFCWPSILKTSKISCEHLDLQTFLPSNAEIEMVCPNTNCLSWPPLQPNPDVAGIGVGVANVHVALSFAVLRFSSNISGKQDLGTQVRLTFPRSSSVSCYPLTSL